MKYDKMINNSDYDDVLALPWFGMEMEEDDEEKR